MSFSTIVFLSKSDTFLSGAVPHPINSYPSLSRTNVSIFSIVPPIYISSQPIPLSAPLESKNTVAVFSTAAVTSEYTGLPVNGNTGV